MNKYLDIAQKVLADSESMLTARQIWDSAVRREYVASDAFGICPWIALGSVLAREVHQHRHFSAFGCSKGKQTYYYLRAISDIWKLPDDLADVMEGTPQTVLLQHIRSRDPRPRVKVIAVPIYERDPHVIAYVRARAEYRCEMCDAAGFVKDNERPYIEVHHLKRLADGGSDIPENAVALCANCHRKLHYMQGRETLLAEFVAELAAKGIDVKPQ